MRHIPNIISVIRILLIPFFVWQMWIGNTLNAAVILGISGLTDTFDGMLARKFGWVSQLGKVLDPAADKLTQVTVCIVLIVKLRQYWYFFAILLFKELVMLILGGYLMKKGVKLEGARWFGKVVTVLFYVSMVLILFWPGMPEPLLWVLLTATVLAAIMAGLLYMPQFTKYMKRR